MLWAPQKDPIQVFDKIIVPSDIDQITCYLHELKWGVDHICLLLTEELKGITFRFQQWQINLKSNAEIDQNIVFFQCDLNSNCSNCNLKLHQIREYYRRLQITPLQKNYRKNLEGFWFVWESSLQWNKITLMMYFLIEFKFISYLVSTKTMSHC